MAQRKVIYKSPNEIIPYENNPRNIEKAVDAVADSIREFGFRNPILVDGDMVIIAGHTRREAAIRLGLDKVPVLVVDDLDEDQVKAFRLADNKVAEIATWDFNMLNSELAGIEMDISGFGIVPTGNISDYDFDEVEGEAEGSKKPDRQVTCPRCGAVVED